MNKGASRPPAVTGSITIDNSGIPTMENPPPNAPFMKQIRKTPAKATRMVVAVSSTRPPPQLRHASQPRPVGIGDETTDRRFDLATRDADVRQCAIVEFAKGRNGIATDEITRDRIQAAAEKPGERVRSSGDRGAHDG